MDSFKGFRKSGTFTVAAGVEVHGELILDHEASTLDLYDKKALDTHRLPDNCILGILHDRTRVSLIQCITTTMESGGGYRDEEQYHFSKVFPHFVIFGSEHVTATDKKITSVSFHVQDASSLFYALGDRP